MSCHNRKQPVGMMSEYGRALRPASFWIIEITNICACNDEWLLAEHSAPPFPPFKGLIWQEAALTEQQAGAHPVLQVWILTSTNGACSAVSH